MLPRKVFLSALALLLATAMVVMGAEGDRSLRAVNLEEATSSAARNLFFFGPKCPRVAPVHNFDLARYVEKSWFIQMQQVNPYQSANQLYCVAATYERDEHAAFVNVFNYGNNDRVNGAPQTSYGNVFSRLCAKVRARDDTAELAVAPCFLRKIGVFDWLAGPYWVIAMDKVNYEWAIVSGGQPGVVKQTDPVKCTTRDDTVNGSGLWLFTRVQTGPRAEELTRQMLAVLDSMGVFTGDLKKVVQEGCKYEGANLKL